MRRTHGKFVRFTRRYNYYYCRITLRRRRRRKGLSGRPGSRVDRARRSPRNRSINVIASRPERVANRRGDGRSNPMNPWVVYIILWCARYGHLKPRAVCRLFVSSVSLTLRLIICYVQTPINDSDCRPQVRPVHDTYIVRQSGAD